MKKTQEQLLNEELSRFLSINKYVGGISEQEEAPAPEEAPVADEPTMDVDMGDEEVASAEPEMGAEEAPADGGELEGMDVGDEMPVDDMPAEEPADDTEEVDVTDLVNGQKELEGKFADTEEKIAQSVEKMDGAFSKLDDLEVKISELDKLYAAIDQLGTKIDQAKPKSPEEKLELRSLDSYPFNQKLTDFFDEKETEMEVTGKNEYVLTSDDVKNMTDRDVKDSFLPSVEDEEETEETSEEK